MNSEPNYSAGAQKAQSEQCDVVGTKVSDPTVGELIADQVGALNIRMAALENLRLSLPESVLRMKLSQFRSLVHFR